MPKNKQVQYTSHFPLLPFMQQSCQMSHLVLAAGNIKSDRGHRVPIFPHNDSALSIASPLRAIIVDIHYYILDESRGFVF